MNRKNEGTGKPALAARAAIDLGPVVIDATGEIFGDVPNVATRAQTLADPDTVVVTARVQRQVAGLTIVVLTLLASGPALAETLDAETARRFVVGRLFEFTCFDGSRGAGRVYDDGSVIGTIQFHGSGPVRLVWLPTGTLKVKGETVCASLNGSPIEQCFQSPDEGQFAVTQRRCRPM